MQRQDGAIKLWHGGVRQIGHDPASHVVAVSGGVDSVVLLDVLAQQAKKPLIVAHVHHGIRRESDEECSFVERLATQYGAQFESVRLHLGAKVSEAVARQQRYLFLRKVAAQHDGLIVTGHHADDIIETIALHLQRGTGWRGLAVMGASDIWRPLAWYTKEELLKYARARSLEWREDASNSSRRYARNRIRPLVAQLSDDTKQQLLALWHSQQLATRAIDKEAGRLLSDKRYFYTMAPLSVAQEVLRAQLLSQNVTCTRPVLQSAILAIKVARPGTKYSLDARHFLQFGKIDFTLIKKE